MLSIIWVKLKEIYITLIIYVQFLADIVRKEVVRNLLSFVSRFIKLRMPDVFSVKRCLQAIRFILPKDTAMKVLVKWYNIYNAPGGPSMHQEWNLLVTCLMTLMGYNTERLSWTRNVSNVCV